jgi:hypothetical protein
MGLRHGTASWPGAIAVESATYTVSHGITPGVARLEIQPQDVPPAFQGDLILTDGNETIPLRDCKVKELLVDHQGRAGVVWVLLIEDRRWRWRNLGFIAGSYNQLDPRGKLIWWTIRSPEELARLCLKAMGEDDYLIDLPAGLTESHAPPNAGFPEPGIHNITGTNPPVVWDYLNPAEALQRLAEQYGRRVVFQPVGDTVLVTTLGVGDGLPDGSKFKEGPGIKVPDLPDAVGVIGAPNRYEMFLALEPVGLEWDNSYRRLDELSYAPLSTLPGPPGRPGQIQWTEVSFQGGAPDSTIRLTLYVEGPNAVVPLAGAVAFSVVVPPVAGGVPSPAAIMTVFATLINTSRDPRIQGQVFARVINGRLNLFGVRPGDGFTVNTRIVVTQGFALYRGTAFEADLLQAPAAPVPAGPVVSVTDWANCDPQTFATVRATGRLTYQEARERALRSVWKVFRVIDRDVSWRGPINVPGYGRLKRRQQLILQDTRVEQIVPAPEDSQRIDPNTGERVSLNFYDGYSRDKPARLLGGVSRDCLEWFSLLPPQALLLPNPVANTDPNAEVSVRFTVDPELQQVTVQGGKGLWFDGGPRDGHHLDPRLALNTAVLVRNADTNQIERFRLIRPVGNSGTAHNPHVAVYEDVQLGVIGSYTPERTPPDRLPGFTGSGNWTLAGVDILEADPLLRAEHYLAGLAVQYQVRDAQTTGYNGLRAFDPDGAIQQITWSVGPGGAETVASRNTEHNVFVPPYPVRRRAEFLGTIPLPPQRENLYSGRGTVGAAGEVNGSAAGGPGVNAYAQ